MQSNGCLDIRIIRHPRRVVLFGYVPTVGKVYNQLYKVKNYGSIDDQEQRICRMLGQYRHWLEYIFLLQKREREESQC